MLSYIAILIQKSLIPEWVIVNLQSIVNSFQKRSRKTSNINPPPREAERLSKKNSVNFSLD